MIRSRTPKVRIIGFDDARDAIVVEARAEARLPARWRLDQRWLLPIAPEAVPQGSTLRLTLDSEGVPTDLRASGEVIWQAPGRFLARSNYGRLPQRRPVIFCAVLGTLDEAIIVAQRGDPLRPRVLPDWADVIRMGATEREHDALWSWYPMFGGEPRMLRVRSRPVTAD